MTARRITRKESNRRLLKLARFLKTLPPERFDYSRFTGEDATTHSCGSSGCALGWAVSIPEFKRLGFRLSDPPILFPEYKGLSDFYAAVVFFGVSLEQSRDLFSQDIYASATGTLELEPGHDPVYVAQKIQDFVIVRTVLGC